MDVETKLMEEGVGLVVRHALAKVMSNHKPPFKLKDIEGELSQQIDTDLRTIAQGQLNKAILELKELKNNGHR